MARGADPAGQHDRHPPGPYLFDAAARREGPERGRVSCYDSWGKVEVVPASLRAIAPFRGCTDPDLLATAAACLAPVDFAAGDVIVSAGQPADGLFVIARGRAARIGHGRAGNPPAVLTGGDHFGPVTDPPIPWEYTVKALTAVTVLTLSRTTLHRLTRLSRPPRKPPPPAR